MEFCVVLVTAPRGKEAEGLARLLLDRKLCACVNIINSVDSFFRWKGRVDRAKEALLVIKTKKDRLSPLFKAIKSVHSYSVCEIIALPIVKGNKDYLDWITASVKKG